MNICFLNAGRFCALAPTQRSDFIRGRRSVEGDPEADTSSNWRSLSVMAREHVLNVVLDVSQVVEGIDVVEPGPDLPLLTLERMPQDVLEVFPAARGVRNFVVGPPQFVHLAYDEMTQKADAALTTNTNVARKLHTRLANQSLHSLTAKP